MIIYIWNEKKLLEVVVAVNFCDDKLSYLNLILRWGTTQFINCILTVVTAQVFVLLLPDNQAYPCLSLLKQGTVFWCQRRHRKKYFTLVTVMLWIFGVLCLIFLLILTESWCISKNDGDTGICRFVAYFCCLSLFTLLKKGINYSSSSDSIDICIGE